MIKENLDIVRLQENLEKACDEPDRIVSKKYAAPFLGRYDG
jgi:hypothetical protein